MPGSLDRPENRRQVRSYRGSTQPGRLARSIYVQGGYAQQILQVVGLIGRGWPFVRLRFFGKTPPKLATDLRDCPCRPRAPVGLGVRLGVVWGPGWPGPTSKVEIDPERPAGYFVHIRPAHITGRANLVYAANRKNPQQYEHRSFAARVPRSSLDFVSDTFPSCPVGLVRPMLCSSNLYADLFFRLRSKIS